jgi:hypothetical protein
MPDVVCAFFCVLRSLSRFVLYSEIIIYKTLRRLGRQRAYSSEVEQVIAAH